MPSIDLFKKLLPKDSGKEQVIDRYGDVKIVKVPESDVPQYITPLLKPSKEERETISILKEIATRVITIQPYQIRDELQRKTVYAQKIREIIAQTPQLKIPKAREEYYIDSVVREMIGYGVIDPLVHDDQLEEIMVIAPEKPVYVFHRKHGMLSTNIVFISDQEIIDLANKIARRVDRRIDLSNPLLDARLPDGSRVNATIPPASVDGSTITIRKFKSEPYTLLDMIKQGSMTSEVAAFLWTIVDGLDAYPANILIAGGTGSGKTTMLNVLASLIPDRERIISIEDTAELKLPLKHWIRMEVRPPGLEGKGEITMDMLTKNSLRMRPDRLIVGEVRGEEAFSLFVAMNTGQQGSMGTIHANSAEETIVRVTSPPMNVSPVMLSALDFLIVMHRINDPRKGTIRRIAEISEVSGALKGKPETRALYKRDPVKDTLVPTNLSSDFLNALKDFTGNSMKELEKIISDRQKFLDKLVKEEEHMNMEQFKERLRKKE